jgi:hypothetical protein
MISRQSSVQRPKARRAVRGRDSPSSCIGTSVGKRGQCRTKMADGSLSRRLTQKVFQHSHQAVDGRMIPSSLPQHQRTRIPREMFQQQQTVGHGRHQTRINMRNVVKYLNLGYVMILGMGRITAAVFTTSP